MWLPRYKELILPTSCTLSCNGCQVWQEHIPELINDLPELTRYQQGIVHITGGDPLLHDQLPLILHTLKEQKNFIILTSPCIRINQLPINILKLIDLIFCYMPGIDHESIRENTGYDVYSQYYLSLSSLSEQKRKVIINYPLTPENASTLPDIYNLSVRLKQYLLITHNRNTGSIPREYKTYYNQRPTVISYSYTDGSQKTCLGCPQRLWRIHPFSLSTLLQGFYKLYL